MGEIHLPKSPKRTSPWRIIGWSLAAAVLLVPLVAMQFTAEVNWGVEDFVFAAVSIGTTGALLEAAARMTRNGAYRGAVAIALAAAFLLIWINAAVGIIGTEDNPANLMYAGVLAVGAIGAAIARFKSAGMARAMIAAACAQIIVGLVAVPGGEATLPLDAAFAALWLTAAWLFRKADGQQTAAHAPS